MIRKMTPQKQKGRKEGREERRKGERRKEAKKEGKELLGLDDFKCINCLASIAF